MTKNLKNRVSFQIHQYSKTMKELTNLIAGKPLLLGYKLRQKRKTGLDIAGNLNQNSPCYLVTNSFQDPLIQREYKRLRASQVAPHLISLTK